MLEIFSVDCRSVDPHSSNLRPRVNPSVGDLPVQRADCSYAWIFSFGVDPSLTPHVVRGSAVIVEVLSTW